MVESDGPDSVLDVASELRRFYDNCLPVGFDYVDGDRWSEGFVAHVGDDFAIFSRLQQRTWLNGYRAIRFDSIRKVGASGDAEFICRAMKARKEEIPPNIRFVQFQWPNFYLSFVIIFKLPCWMMLKNMAIPAASQVRFKTFRMV